VLVAQGGAALTLCFEIQPLGVKAEDLS
jgi:hypothetical protein